MEKDHKDQSHWFPLAENMAIQGLLTEQDNESRVYVVTVPPPIEYSWIHDRWPRLVKLSKQGFKVDLG